MYKIKKEPNPNAAASKEWEPCEPFPLPWRNADGHCRSCSGNHSCCEFMCANVHVMPGRAFSDTLPFSRLFRSLCSLFHDVPCVLHKMTHCWTIHHFLSVLTFWSALMSPCWNKRRLWRQLRALFPVNIYVYLYESQFRDRKLYIWL